MGWIPPALKTLHEWAADKLERDRSLRRMVLGYTARRLTLVNYSLIARKKRRPGVIGSLKVK